MDERQMIHYNTKLQHITEDIQEISPSHAREAAASAVETQSVLH